MPDGYYELLNDFLMVFGVYALLTICCYLVCTITDGEARTVEVSLDFLDRNREYEATLYRDGDKAGWDTYPTDYAIVRRTVTSRDTLKVHMAPGGGFALQLQAY